MRTPMPLVVSGALVAGLVLGACGTRTAGPGEEGGDEAGRCGTGAMASPGPEGAALDGVRIVGMVERAGGGAAPPGGSASPSSGTRTDVSVTADSLPRESEPPGPCALAYTVSNPKAEPFTYTITFALVDDRGRAMSSVEETVTAVGAGRTVRRTLDGVGGGPHSSRRARITDVKRVPADEAPAPEGSCPASGLRIHADDGDAAMGLRVVGLHLENCGSRPYSLEGYPALELLDAELEPVEGVRIVPGGRGVARVSGFDAPARPVTLEPGESARAGLMWRNTTQAGEAVTVPYVRVRARSGAAPVVIAPHLDLGTTGKLGVGAWREDDAP
ncbi:DUF4232 domain-containing protein [Streptomyces sp. NPDC004783]|uniref:DUF4232 domain-containing protein n=1 Tax=Streptomyces sp. NPDC004783 TaxID=3154459 RepID=UPI00339E3E80